jgi:hypothetical protein
MAVASVAGAAGDVTRVPGQPWWVGPLKDPPHASQRLRVFLTVLSSGAGSAKAPGLPEKPGQGKRQGRGRTWKPARRKSASRVYASRTPYLCMTANDVQSVSENSWSLNFRYRLQAARAPGLQSFHD